jgi:hypothetical protein
MSSRTDPRIGRLPLAAGAAMCAFALACSATGDQFLGTVMSDKATQTDASPAGSEAGGACPPTRQGALEEAHSDLDIFFTVDSSQQSFNPDQWDTFVSGFTRFLHLDSANGIGMGIVYFPAQSPEACGGRCQPGDCGCLMACGCDCGARFDPRSCQQRSPCDASAYQTPDVDIAPLPQNAGPLAASLFTQNPFGQRTIRPALQGSLDHLAFFEGSHPGQRVVEVLIAGGSPSSDCQPGSIADCAGVADGSNAKTFVVAFDTADSPFDPIAARGGTERAIRFDANRAIEDQFVILVSTIRKAPYCEYALPDGVDYRNINVTLTAVVDAGLSPVFPVSRVRDRGSCDNGLGWYSDRTHIVACDETCRKIRAGMQPTVNVCDPTPP